MLMIDSEYSGVSVNAVIDNKLCYFFDESGTGKTFFFSIVKCFCDINGIKCSVLDFNDAQKDEDVILKDCEKMEVVILDNADLYLSNEILEKIAAPVVLISVKTFAEWVRKDAGLYLIEYEGKTMNVRRWRNCA